MAVDVPAGAGNVTTNSTSLTATTTTITGTRPANTTAGDFLCFVVHFQQANGTPVITPPDGFLRAGPAYATTVDSRRPSGTYYLPDGVSAPATFDVSTSANAGRAQIIVFRITGLPADAAVYEGAWRSPINTDATVNLPQVTVGADGAVLVGFAYANMSAGVAAPTVSMPDGLTLIGSATNGSTGGISNGTLAVGWQAVDAGDTGTRAVTWSTTPANSSGYMVAFAPATPPASTGMRVIAHRGIATGQPETDEESVAGLTDLMAAHPRVNGVEIDARISSDGVVFLMHDETGARTHPAMGTDGVEDCTAAQLDGYGVTRLTDYLDALKPYHHDTIQVQHYTAATQPAVQPIVDACKAHRLRRRIMLMTSVSTGPAFAALRSAGWTYRIGCYGLTAANWATHSAAFVTYGIHAAFTPPGEYDTHRAFIPTLTAAGIAPGASTENTTQTAVTAEGDGVRYLLTDDPSAYTSRFIAPRNALLTAGLTQTPIRPGPRVLG